MKPVNLVGCVVFGIVKKILPHCAFLQLPDVDEFGYLSFSQVSDETIEPPLTNIFNVGDRVEVLVKWFDETHRMWEVSHKAVVLRSRWEAKGLLAQGTVLSATVVRADETRAVLDVEGVRCRIYGKSGLWNAYTVLYEAGDITPGAVIQVLVEQWDPKEAEPRIGLCHCEAPEITRGTIVDGEVILFRRSFSKNSFREFIREYIYAKFGDGQIASVQVRDITSAESTFPLGSSIPFVIGKYSHYLRLFEAYLDLDRAGIPTGVPPALGTILEARVSRVFPNGAFCLISDRLYGYLPHSTVINEIDGDARQHLHPGDTVKVSVDQPSKRGVQLRFLHLVDRILEPESTQSENIVDLKASRRTGSPSGFQRNQQFRRDVLDVFDHTCCVCGARHVFGNSSAMEAAHIIPRANRGADSTRNALCLCALHHWAFDRGFLAIDEYYRVVVARQIIEIGESGSIISTHHGNTIFASDKTLISFDALAWHRRNIFLDDCQLLRNSAEADDETQSDH